MDKMGANFLYSLESVQSKLGANTLVLQIPIGAESNLTGIVDIVSQKAYYFEKKDIEESYSTGEIPSELLPQVSKFRNDLLEKVVLFDDDLLSKYVSDGTLSEDEIKFLIRKATISAKMFPVFCGTAFKNVGIKLLLDGIVDYLPSPFDCNETIAYSASNVTERIKLEDNDCAALAFKVVNNPFGKGSKTSGKLTFIRVYSGKLVPNTYFYNSNSKKEFRIGRLLRMHADKSKEVTEIKAGDIAAAVGLKEARTGDTICYKEKPLFLENISFADPVISIAIEPKTRNDEEKLKNSLEKISEEDPTLKYHSDKETGQMIISGMGELHLEVIVDKMRSQYDVEVNTGKPQVAYRETIKNIVQSQGKYIKQSGGHGQYGDVWIKFEPNPGKGFEFVNAIKGDAIHFQYIGSVEKGLIESLSSGLLLGYPVVDVKATLYDGSYHDVDSSEVAFKAAASICLRGSKEKLGIVLLEPVMNVEVVVPDEGDYCGKAISIINSRRGSIQNIELIGNLQKVYSHCPLSEMSGFLTELRSATAGRGTYSMEFFSYQEVPKEVSEDIIRKRTGSK